MAKIYDLIEGNVLLQRYSIKKFPEYPSPDQYDIYQLQDRYFSSLSWRNSKKAGLTP